MLVKLIKRAIGPLCHRMLLDYFPKVEIELRWSHFSSKPIDWDNPRTLNEKIQWLILYSDTREWTRLADKLLVRDYVKEKGLGDLLVPLLGVWDDADDIDFEELPERFVLKCNHDSGSTILVNKNQIYDRKAICAELNAKLKKKFGYNNAEPHYNGINPKVLAEMFLDFSDQHISSSPIDYKVFCYNGEPDVILVTYNRHPQRYLNLQVRDLVWRICPEYGSDTSFYKHTGDDMPQPISLREMIEAAHILSEGFPQVRVDFYDIKGKLYFGEMTFTSDCGRMPYFSETYQSLAGKKINLELAKRKK